MDLPVLAYLSAFPEMIRLKGKMKRGKQNCRTYFLPQAIFHSA